MSNFSVGGLASGLDTKSIIDQLMSIESRPKTNLEWKQQLWTSRKNAWSDLNSRLLTLQTKANALINPATWNQTAPTGPTTTYGATSGDPSRLGATVTGSNPPVGTHTVDVLQLARGEISTSTGALAPATSGVRSTGAFYEGNNNVVEGNENITALRTQTGGAVGLNTNSTITMQYTVNGITQNATFKVNTLANGGNGTTLTDFANWVQATVGNGAAAAWSAGKLEVTTAPGTANALTGLSFTAKNAVGTTLANFNSLAGASSSTTTAATNGGAGADTLTITNGSGSWNVAIAAGDDKAAIVSKINATSGIGVTALLNGSGQVELRSNTIGAASAFTVTSAGALASQLGFAETQTAQDATFSVDGTTHTSASNTNVTGILTDVSLNLLGTTSTTLNIQPSSGSSGTSAQDQWIASVKQKVKDFVSAYNESLSYVYQRTQGESKVVNPKNLGEYLQGPMARDVGFSSVSFDLRKLAGESVSGLPAGATMLSEIGIDIQFAVGSAATNGQLSVDDTKLEAALRANPQGVQDILGKVGTGSGISADDGIVRRISEQVSLLRVGGRVDTSITGASTQIKSIQDGIDRATERLDRRKAYYERMFSSLETVLGKMQSQGSWLSSQIASLQGNSGK